MMQGTLIPIIVEGIKTLKDGSVSLTVSTQELSPGKAGELFSLRNKICYAYFSERQIEDNEKKMVDSLDPELKGKTPGQRLRGVLYRCWEQSNEGYKDSDSYYKAKMEQIISTYKSNLQA
jgi:hypothetical protein